MTKEWVSEWLTLEIEPLSGMSICSPSPYLWHIPKSLSASSVRLLLLYDQYCTQISKMYCAVLLFGLFDHLPYHPDLIKSCPRILFSLKYSWKYIKRSKYMLYIIFSNEKFSASLDLCTYNKNKMHTLTLRYWLKVSNYKTQICVTGICTAADTIFWP